jgi:hypothetical protein
LALYQKFAASVDKSVAFCGFCANDKTLSQPRHHLLRDALIVFLEVTEVDLEGNLER